MGNTRKSKAENAPPAEVCEGCELRCTLDQAKRGDKMVVLGVDDDRARIHAIRFGMGEGACVQCVTRIPAGPIVLRSGRQEIAVGRELAKRITVRPQTEKD
ncbi:MAG TPA: ferrous iron transport protein A [Coriobacteriia bacterium]|jgi:Fe2+ transport system protein FeoA